MADDIDDIPDSKISQDQQEILDRFLLLAVTEKNYDRINICLKKGADINARNGDKRTPLMLAVSSGHTFLVQFVLGKGPDLLAKDKYGYTAFDFVQNTSSRDEILNSMLNAFPDHIRKAAKGKDDALRMAEEEAAQKKPVVIEAPATASFRQKPKGFNP